MKASECLPRQRIGSSLTAVRFYPGRNMDRSPRRYTMDPADVVAALVDMKREKTRLGAIVHSHPNHASCSFSDRPRRGEVIPVS